MKTRTPQEAANEQTIRKLYSLGEAANKDKLAQFTRRHTFRTILGDVKFADGGRPSGALER